MITVEGRGRASAEPDIVTVSFDVEAESSDYGECIDLLNARAEGLRKGMSSSGLDRAMLKTSNFHVGTMTEYQDGRRVFAGYRASHKMQIELPADKEFLNKVLRHVAQSHSEARIDLSFSVRDQAGLRKKALTRAVESARENAETLASAAGIALGKLVRMDYGWTEIRFSSLDSSIEFDELELASECDADIDPIDVFVEDSVSLVYEIEEKRSSR